MGLGQTGGQLQRESEVGFGGIEGPVEKVGVSECSVSPGDRIVEVERAFGALPYGTRCALQIGTAAQGHVSLPGIPPGFRHSCPRVREDRVALDGGLEVPQGRGRIGGQQSCAPVDIVLPRDRVRGRGPVHQIRG